MYIVRRRGSLRVYQSGPKMARQLQRDIRFERELNIPNENRVINAEVIVVPDETPTMSVQQFLDAARRGEYP